MNLRMVYVDCNHCGYWRETNFSIPVYGGDTCAPRTELNTHAYMRVLGRQCYVFDTVQGRHCDVQPYGCVLGSMKRVSVVDVTVDYDCSYTHKTY